MMSDTRNALLAWVSSITSLFAAIDTRDLIAVVSAIVLPVVFFTVGKTVDVLVQIYVAGRSRSKEEELDTDSTDRTDGNGPKR